MYVSVLAWMSIPTYVHMNIMNKYVGGWKHRHVCVNKGSDFDSLAILLCVSI